MSSESRQTRLGRPGDPCSSEKRPTVRHGLEARQASVAAGSEAGGSKGPGGSAAAKGRGEGDRNGIAHTARCKRRVAAQTERVQWHQISQGKGEIGPCRVCSVAQGSGRPRCLQTGSGEEEEAQDWVRVEVWCKATVPLRSVACRAAPVPCRRCDAMRVVSNGPCGWSGMEPWRIKG